MRTIAHIVLAFAVVSVLSACMPFAGVIGMAPSTIQAAAQLDQIKLIADGASFAGSGKTLTDHALTLATGYDCSVMSGLQGAGLCVPMCR